MLRIACGIHKDSVFMRILCKSDEKKWFILTFTEIFAI